MKLSNESAAVLNQCLKRLVSHYSEMKEEIVTDIHLQPVLKSGELIVFNDDDEELEHISIPEMMNLNPRSAQKEVEAMLRRSLEPLRKQFETLPILKPFSFVMVDLEKETICDLLLVDDELILADDELLKGLDEDLNDFLKKLLAD